MAVQIKSDGSEEKAVSEALALQVQGPKFNPQSTHKGRALWLSLACNLATGEEAMCGFLGLLASLPSPADKVPGQLSQKSRVDGI